MELLFKRPNPLLNLLLNQSYTQHFGSSCILTSAGNESKLGDPTDLKSHPVDITYVRFRCTIHGFAVDARVQYIAELSFNFCLRLQQHTYDEATDDIALVSASHSSYTMDITNRAIRSLNASFAAADDKSVLNTPTNSTISSGTDSASPTMTKFLSSQKSSSGTKKGFFGNCDSWIVLMNLDSRLIIIRSCCLIHLIKRVPK